jgi:hypothetical protein
MKNYNTLEGIERYYITNLDNAITEASYMGPNVWYYTDMTVRNSFRAFGMVDTNTLEYILRCDPVTDEQYEEYRQFCEDYDNPEWIVLS